MIQTHFIKDYEQMFKIDLSYVSYVRWTSDSRHTRAWFEDWGLRLTIPEKWRTLELELYIKLS